MEPMTVMAVMVVMVTIATKMIQNPMSNSGLRKTIAVSHIRTEIIIPIVRNIRLNVIIMRQMINLLLVI